MYPYKVAVFGMGRMGKVHLKAALNLGLDIIAVCDSRQNARQEIQSTLGVKSTLFFDNFLELINNVEFDIAVVATTTPERFEIMIELLNLDRELRILSEKPLASSSLELLKLKYALEQSKGKYFVVNHQMRFMQQYSEIKTLIDTGNYGSMKGMIVAASNIGLGMNVTHYFEAFRYLTSNDNITVLSQLEDSALKSPRGNNFEDFAGWVAAMNSSSQRLYLDFSSDIGHGIICIYQFERAKVVVNELEGIIDIFSRDSTYADEPMSRYGLPGTTTSKRIQKVSLESLSETFLQRIIDWGDLPSFHDGFVNTCLALASILSSKNGTVSTNWQDVLDEDIKTKWA